MEKGIYIIPKTTDFIKVLEQLSKQHQPTPTIKLNKHLTNKTQLEKEIHFLNKCSIDVFTGFKTDCLIKVRVTGADGVKYYIKYSFNTSDGSGTIYEQLNRYFRKRDKIYI